MKSAASLLAFLLLGVATLAHAEDDGRNELRKLNLAEDEVVQGPGFTVTIPKGWSYRKITWAKPHVASWACKKANLSRKRCPKDDLIASTFSAIELIASPEASAISSASIEKKALAVSISDQMPLRALENAKASKMISAKETLGGHDWILEKTVMPAPAAEGPATEVDSAFTNLKDKTIDVLVAGSPKAIVAAREKVQAIKASLKASD